MTATPQRRGVKIEERGHGAGPAEHEHGHSGELKADVDPDNTHGGPQHRAEQRQTGAVADDFHGKGLGGRAGDGQIGKDDLGQAGHLADVGVEDLSTDPPRTTDPLGQNNGGRDVFAREPCQ